MERGYRISLVVIVVVLALTTLIAWWLWWHPRADDFLGDADFEGAPIPNSPITSSPITTRGQSTYNGVVTITNLDRTLVEALLPSGFVLAENQSFYHKTKHPVLLLYGDQTDGAIVDSVSNVVTPTPPQNRGHFSEAILAIPYVQRTGQPGWHTYIVRMYLDNQAAVQGGTLFGYAKEPACLDWRGAIVKVWQAPFICPGSNILQPKLLEGSFRSTGVWYDATLAYTKISNLKDMVGMVTTRILGRSAFGASICSFFEWNLDDARVARATTTFRFQSPFRSDMSAWPGLGELSNVKAGAVAIRGVRWRLGPAPVPCGFP